MNNIEKTVITVNVEITKVQNEKGNRTYLTLLDTLHCVRIPIGVMVKENDSKTWGKYMYYINELSKEGEREV